MKARTVSLRILTAAMSFGTVAGAQDEPGVTDEAGAARLSAARRTATACSESDRAGARGARGAPGRGVPDRQRPGDRGPDRSSATICRSRSFARAACGRHDSRPHGSSSSRRSTTSWRPTFRSAAS